MDFKRADLKWVKKKKKMKKMARIDLKWVSINKILNEAEIGQILENKAFHVG